MDIIGLNPLHALFPGNPAHASPYSPSSRLFLNILYLDLEAVEDFTECDEARSMVEDERFQARLRALRSEELVDYSQVMEAKQTILDCLYRHFRERHLKENSERGQQFREFQWNGLESLRRYALFEALQAHFQKQDASTIGVGRYGQKPTATRQRRRLLLSRRIIWNRSSITNINSGWRTCNLMR